MLVWQLLVVFYLLFAWTIVALIAAVCLFVVERREARAAREAVPSEPPAAEVLRAA